MERNTYFYTSCLHGFGHGLYQVYKDNLEGAIEVCSHVKDDHNGEDASQCATGVYMEYSAGVSRYPLTTEVSWVTRTHATTPNYACWSTLVHHANTLHPTPHHTTLHPASTRHCVDLHEQCLPACVLASGVGGSGTRHEEHGPEGRPLP